MDITPPTDAAFTSYLGNGGLFGRHSAARPMDLGLFFVNSCVRYKDILDGSSHTFLAGEVRGSGDPHTDDVLPMGLHYPAGSPGYRWEGFWRVTEQFSGAQYMASTYGSFHAGGSVNVAMADGSVQSMEAQTDIHLVRSLSTMAGRETVTGGES